jgi:antitoxin component YwqK of YwqJK toxin-antitoxin module
MKKLSCLILLLLSTLNYAQTDINLGENDKLIYLDSTWNKTSKKKQKYYRIVKDYYLEKDLYLIKDFYNTGVLQMEGMSKAKDDVLEEGEFIYYYENGNKKATTNYIKSLPNGKTSEWYENANKKLEGEYIQNEEIIIPQLKINQFWDTNGAQKVMDGNGFFESNTKFSSEKGEIKNGFKEGFWEGKENKISYKETYENGKLISGVSINESLKSHTYNELQVNPIPEKGMQDFYNYIGTNFYYTQESIKNNILGKILIKFEVDKKGKIIKTKIIKGLGYGLDEVAIRLLLRYGDWKPGKQRGVETSCSFILPLSLQANP